MNSQQTTFNPPATVEQTDRDLALLTRKHRQMELRGFADSARLVAECLDALLDHRNALVRAATPLSSVPRGPG